MRLEQVGRVLTKHETRRACRYDKCIDAPTIVKSRTCNFIRYFKLFQQIQINIATVISFGCSTFFIKCLIPMLFFERVFIKGLSFTKGYKVIHSFWIYWLYIHCRLMTWMFFYCVKRTVLFILINVIRVCNITYLKFERRVNGHSVDVGDALLQSWALVRGRLLNKIKHV